MTRTPWKEISAKDRTDPAQAARIEEQARAMRDALAPTKRRRLRGETQESFGVSSDESPVDSKDDLKNVDG
jgi:hypothetical protein